MLESTLSAQQFQTARAQGARLLSTGVYTDANRSGAVDSGDELLLEFDHAVVVNGARGTSFEMPVAGDSLGTGATVAAGPLPTQVKITLGSGAALKVRGVFSSANVGTRAPSGIDVAGHDATRSDRHRDWWPSRAPGTGADLVAASFGSRARLGRSGGRRVLDVECDGDLDVLTVDSGA